MSGTVGDRGGGGGGYHTVHKPIYRVPKSAPLLFTFDSAHILNSSAQYQPIIIILILFTQVSIPSNIFSIIIFQLKTTVLCLKIIVTVPKISGFEISFTVGNSAVKSFYTSCLLRWSHVSL